MRRYLDCITEPTEYLVRNNELPLPPNATGTPVCPLKDNSVVNMDTSVPMCLYSNGTASTSESGLLCIATNTPGKTRFLYSDPSSSSSLLVDLALDSVVNILRESEVNTSGGLTNPSIYYADGIMEGSKFGSAGDTFIACNPAIGGTRAWPMTINNATSRTFGIQIDVPNVQGIAECTVDLMVNSAWQNIATISLASGSGSVDWTMSDTFGSVTAIRIGFAASTAQVLKFEFNMFAKSANAVFSIPKVMNRLTGITTLFKTALQDGTILSYYPVAAGEVITNVTNVTDQGQIMYALSSQRYAGIYVNAAQTWPDLFGQAQVNWYKGNAALGASGWYQPAMLEPFPIPFSARGWLSDARVYFVSNPPNKIQSFAVSISTCIGAIGLRTATTQYKVPQYPHYWPVICNAFALTNPMSCNPGHLAAFSKVAKSLANWLKQPENVGKVLTGAADVAEVVQKLTASVAPRVSGLAGQVKTGLDYIR